MTRRPTVLALLAAALLLAAAPVNADEASPETPTAAYAARVAEAPHDVDATMSLGLRYAREGSLGEAIVMLERAHRLAPTDREIEDALARAHAEARQRRVEAAGAATIVEGEPRRVFSWRFFGGLRPPAYALTLLLGVWLATLGAWRMRATSGGRRDAWTVALAAGLIGGATGGAAWLGAAWTARTVHPAVVVADAPSWRDAPDALARGTREPNLYEGAVVLIVDERDGWRSIELVDGERGWVPTGDVTPIQPRR